MRLFLGLLGCSLWYASQGDFQSLTTDQVMTCLGGSAGAVLVVKIVRWPFRRKRSRDRLDRPVYRWTKRDVLTQRDLLRSIAIFGASGSGKSSGSGFQLALAAARIPNSGGLILASKPEDRAFWLGVFKRAGREKDLIILGPKEVARCNFIDFEMQSGGDARSLTQFVTIVGETLDSEEGHSTEPFWKKSEHRLDYNAIEAIRLALSKVTAPDIQRFISTAAYTPQQLVDPSWQKGFHHLTMQTANGRPKTQIEAHDWAALVDYWVNEFPSMDNKPRSSILAGVMNTLHVFNTGIVRETVSTTTNVSPADMDKGKWILIDFPLAEFGASGKFIMAGWKFLTQKYVLRRHAKPGDGPIIIWADEAQNMVNSFDSAYLAECRSHKGCMVYLTQSIHSYYGNMEGPSGEHKADALMTNFYTKIFHVCGDAKTAQFASSLLGQQRETFVSGSSGGGKSRGEELFGASSYSGSFSESYQPVLQPAVFLSGMRTGGQGIVDGIVIRAGNWLWCQFAQDKA